MSYTMQCPKCHSVMRTYNRGGVQIEQCDGCRGVFLDYGELEALTRLESQWAQPAPPPVAPAPHYGQPAWGAPHGGHYGHGHGHKGGFARLLFSS
jgi:Zn-finger nucleic acid-binding protein